MKRKRLNVKQQFDVWKKRIDSDIDNNKTKNILNDFLEFTRKNFFIKNTRIINNEEKMYNSMKSISEVYLLENEKKLEKRKNEKIEKEKMDLFFRKKHKKLIYLIKNKNILNKYLEITRKKFLIKNTKKINNKEKMYNSMKSISENYLLENEKKLEKRKNEKIEKEKMDLFFRKKHKKLIYLIKNKIV